MKDIKQYFINGTKIDKEIINVNDDAKQKEKEQEETAERDGRKRKRVKIRISRVSSEERTCDIVESKNDLVDKTPSPFAKENCNKKVLQDESPKSILTCSSTEQNSKKDSKLNIEINGDKSKKVKNILQHEKTNEDKDKLNKQIIDLNDSSDDNHSIKDVYSESLSNIKFQDDIGSQREESNAFQVLMNHSKPIQYKLSVQQSTEDAKCNEKSNDSKELKAKHKRKLLTLANKKGYSKRKFAEAEESERIEKNIENRKKFFKSESKKDDNTESMKNNKQPSGKLFDYLNKSTSELTDKDMQCVSTFIVKADVHRSDTADIEPVLKSASSKIYSSKKCSKFDWDLSKVDDIHVVASENLISPQTVKQDNKQKPRWSLRIKLHSSEDSNSQNDDTDDELFSLRSKSKYDTGYNIFKKCADTYVKSDEKKRLRNHNGHIEAKNENKKNESLEQKRNSVQVNVTKNTTIKNNDENSSDFRTRKSDKVNKVEDTFKSMNKTFITVDSNSDCEIINENISENVLKRKPNQTEKLAPLFTKRRKTDPVIATARRLFLQSDIIGLENKLVNRKANSYCTPTLPFPAISHITQLERSELCISTKHKFPMRVAEEYLPTIDINEYKRIINYNKNLKAPKTTDSAVKATFNQVLSEIVECPDKQKMWETVSAIKNKTEAEKQSLPRLRGGKKTKLLGKKVKVESVKESQLHDYMWTRKYKPMSVQEIVGNEEAARKLKDWLSGWRSSQTMKDYSSGDEFYSSDSSNISRKNETDHIAVLLGPHGSGKSASVYAVAEELGYSILEVNASSRRTGKRILKEFDEATKSHRVKKNEHKFVLEQLAKENKIPKISQNSLILLEDIDLIFEEDEGFISAAYQLASNTKRPIVMTCRTTCSYLSKMAPQLYKIYFQKVNGGRPAALLKLITLAETGYNLPHSCLMTLLQAGDLRKALLQLQYLLLSGAPIMSEQSTTMAPSLWQDAQHSLYLSAIKLNRKRKTKKNGSGKKFDERAADTAYDTLNDLAIDLDNLSMVSLLIDIDDVALNASETSAQPNLSLAEDLSLYSSLCQLSADIANFISDKTVCKNWDRRREYMQNQMNIILRKQLNHGVDLALSHVTSTCLDQRVIATDYLPTARAICRAEECRSHVNYKRGNRFFHYLHNLNVPTALMKSNILAAACRTLQEKAEKSTLVIEVS